MSLANSVFETEWWLDAVAPERWSAVILKDGDRIVARWPYVRHGGNIVMPQLTQTLGFCIEPEMLRGDFSGEKLNKMTEELLSGMPVSNNIKIHLDPANTYFLPFHWHGFAIVPRITYRIDDLSDTGVVYARFSGMVKKNIKNAEKKLIVTSDRDIDDLMVLLDKTFKLQKRATPFDERLVKRIYHAARQRDACRLTYIIDADNNIHSGALFVYDANTFYYLIAVSDPAFRNSGSNSLLIWDGIKYAAQVSRRFDFEGSMIQGIEHFFRGFGGTPVVYYEIRKQGFLREVFELLKPRIKKLIGYK